MAQRKKLLTLADLIPARYRPNMVTRALEPTVIAVIAAVILTFLASALLEGG